MRVAAQRHLGALRQRRASILRDVHGPGVPPADLEQQLRGALDGALLVARDPRRARSAARRPSRGRKRRAAAGDGGRREERRLEQHVDGVGACTAVRAAHDAGHAHGPCVVGDHQHVVVEPISLPSSSVMRLAGVAQAAPRGRP